MFELVSLNLFQMSILHKNHIKPAVKFDTVPLANFCLSSILPVAT